MSRVTRILSQIESGDPSAADQLLPLVYDDLRKLAAAKLAQEKPGQTLQAAALVHEAYVCLIDAKRARNNGTHEAVYIAAAAETMRWMHVGNGTVQHSDATFSAICFMPIFCKASFFALICGFLGKSEENLAMTTLPSG